MSPPVPRRWLVQRVTGRSISGAGELVDDSEIARFSPQKTSRTTGPTMALFFIFYSLDKFYLPLCLIVSN